jgi:A nuclease family of the HNH/ENDO VII superfamily with conserved AHH
MPGGKSVSDKKQEQRDQQSGSMDKPSQVSSSPARGAAGSPQSQVLAMQRKAGNNATVRALQGQFDPNIEHKTPAQSSRNVLLDDMPPIPADWFGTKPATDTTAPTAQPAASGRVSTEPKIGSPEWVEIFQRGKQPAQLKGGAVIAAQGTFLQKSVSVTRWTYWKTEEDFQKFIDEYIAYAQADPKLKKQYEEAVSSRGALLQQYRDEEARRAAAEMDRAVGELQAADRMKLLKVQPPEPVRARAMVGRVAIPIGEFADDVIKFVPYVGPVIALYEAAIGRSMLGLGPETDADARILGAVLVAAPFAGKIIRAGARGTAAIAEISRAYGVSPQRADQLVRGLSSLEGETKILQKAAVSLKAGRELTADELRVLQKTENALGGTGSRPANDITPPKEPASNVIPLFSHRAGEMESQAERKLAAGAEPVGARPDSTRAMAGGPVPRRFPPGPAPKPQTVGVKEPAIPEGFQDVRPTPNIRTSAPRPSEVLGEALKNKGETAPAEGFDAHHIVPVNQASPELIAKLEDAGIKINDPRNGVWLPKTREIANQYGRTVHLAGIHANAKAYIEALNKRLMNLPTREVAGELERIKQELASGSFHF